MKPVQHDKYLVVETFKVESFKPNEDDGQIATCVRMDGDAETIELHMSDHEARLHPVGAVVLVSKLAQLETAKKKPAEPVDPEPEPVQPKGKEGKHAIRS